MNQQTLMDDICEYFEKELPDEYTGAWYTYSLKRANAKSNTNAFQGIPKMLEIATGKHFSMPIRHDADRKIYLYDIIKYYSTCGFGMQYSEKILCCTAIAGGTFHNCIDES